MKEVPLRIEEMANAREALNQALQQAMSIMSQKNAMEANVSLSINIELSPKEYAGEWASRTKFKTSVQVPVKISKSGVENGNQIFWDQDRAEYMIAIEGEQTRI